MQKNRLQGRVDFHQRVFGLARFSAYIVTLGLVIGCTAALDLGSGVYIVYFVFNPPPPLMRLFLLDFKTKNDVIFFFFPPFRSPPPLNLNLNFFPSCYPPNIVFYIIYIPAWVSLTLVILSLSSFTLKLFLQALISSGLLTLAVTLFALLFLALFSFELLFLFLFLGFLLGSISGSGCKWTGLKIRIVFE